MKLLIPLGLLALLSIIVLIIIYIIKPNYQQKAVSSTYMWKLSLKYRRKRLPTSKIRNILVVLCQVAVLTCCALILSRPVATVSVGTANKNEVVAIIDSSASMRTETNQVTRFERAVTEARKAVTDALQKGGCASLIIADADPHFLFERITPEDSGKAEAALNELDDYDKFCAYGSSNSDAAIALCDSVLAVNNEANIYYYTDAKFNYVPESVNLVSVQNSNEWNAAILDAKVEMIDNFCVITVDVACYNRDREITLNVNVTGANGEEGTAGERRFTTQIRCYGDATQSIMFINKETIADNELPPDGLYYELTDSERIYSYDSIFISLSEGDDFAYDDTFSIYGGVKPVIKVQYTSTLVNNFVNSALLVLQNHYQDKFDLQISEVKLDNNEIPKGMGFDLYIYEHWVPENLPDDGVILLMDPPNGTMPAGANFYTNGQTNASSTFATLTAESNSPLLTNIKAEDITVSRYTRISNYDGYEVLLSCDTYPMLLLKDEVTDKKTSQIMVMPFSVHYSTFGNSMYCPLFMHNVFEYFFPSMTDGFVYEVGESITLNGRGPSVNLADSTNHKWTFKDFPAKFTFTVPGVYMVSQNTYYNASLSEDVFVKIPAKESNICAVEDALRRPVKTETSDDDIDDLLLWFAVALVALLFADWLLQIRSNV